MLILVFGQLLPTMGGSRLKCWTSWETLIKQSERVLLKNNWPCGALELVTQHLTAPLANSYLATGLYWPESSCEFETSHG